MAIVDSKETLKASDPDQTLGMKMRRIRKLQGLSIQEVAGRAGVSVGLVSQIERGLTSPSIRSLRQLGAALKVPVEQFFNTPQNPQEQEQGYVVRPRERQVLALEHIGMTIELISPKANSKMQMFIANIEPGASSGPELDSHKGEEAGLVLSGQLELWVGDKHFILNEGDTFRFSSKEPHRHANPGSMVTRVHWITTPPVY